MEQQESPQEHQESPQTVEELCNVKLGAENSQLLHESKDSKKRAREEKRQVKSEENAEAQRARRVAAGAREERLCCEGCGAVFLFKGRLDAHLKNKVCERRFAATPKRLERLYATPQDLNRAWFAPVPSCNSGVTVPANNLVLKEDDERAWPPSDPSVWKITELHACCSHVGALCAGSKTTLIARLQGTPDPRTSALVAASLDTLDATDMTNTSSSTPTVPLEAATTTSSLHTTTVPATEPTGTAPPPSVVVDRFLKGDKPLKIRDLQRGWARKVEGARPRPPQVIMERRLTWIKGYYDKMVGKGHRANEYVAAREMKAEHLDEDDMWLAPSSLKSAFAKLTARRKVLEARDKEHSNQNAPAAGDAGGATAEVGAGAGDGARGGNAQTVEELTPADLEQTVEMEDADDAGDAGAACVLQ